MTGWTMAAAVLLIAHPKPPAGNQDVGTAVVELSYAHSLRASPRHRLSASNDRPQRVVAPLVVLDVSHHTRSDSAYLVSMDDIARWEEAHGHMPANAVVLARSNAPTQWRSARPAGAVDNAARFPGFSEGAIRFLVEARYAYGLGTETPNGGRSVVLVYRDMKQ